MGKKKGFVLLYRDIMDNELWDDKPFARGQAFIHLLMKANHSPKTILFNGKPITVNRGEILTSVSKLADEWGWSRHKTKDFLVALKNLQMIDRLTDTKKTLIKMLNYDVYQNPENEEGQQKPSRRTSKGHQKDIRGTQTINYNTLEINAEKNTASAAFASGRGGARGNGD